MYTLMITGSRFLPPRGLRQMQPLHFRPTFSSGENEIILGSTSKSPQPEFRWNENCIWCPQIANRRKEMPNFLGLVEPMQIHPQFDFHKSLHHLFLQDCRKVFPTKSEAQLIGGPNKLSFEDVITQSLSLIYLHCSLLPLESFDNIMNYVVVC